MKDILLSVAVGDRAGEPYEFHPCRDYDAIIINKPGATYTDDTVCTFACAEGLLQGAKDLTPFIRSRCKADLFRGYGGMFARWLIAPDPQPYNSFGNGSAMRCAAAACLAKSKEMCIDMATTTAMPTHNHPEGIKGAVATALAIFYLKEGHDKEYIRQHVLNEYYPQWANRTYADIKPDFYFDETCQLTVPPAIICFLESTDFTDCLKKNIALGGDADTLCAIAAPMAYAFYKEMPLDALRDTIATLPQWMLDINQQVGERMAAN